MIQLTREATVDAARREYPVTHDSAYVAIVEEGDLNVSLRLERGRGTDPSLDFEDVEANLWVGGIEVAILEAKAGDLLTLKLESAHQYDHVGRINVRVLRFDLPASDSRVRARLDSYRAWTAATRKSLKTDAAQSAYVNLEPVIAHLQSADGDRYLLGRAHLLRANLGYDYQLGWMQAAGDARLAEQVFLGLDDARLMARARLTLAGSLIEAANDRTHAAPEQLASEAERILVAIEGDVSLTPRMRAQAEFNHAALAYHRGELTEAQAHGERSLALLRSAGNLDSFDHVLNNTASLAIESGKLRQAIAIYDELLARLPGMRITGLKLAVVRGAALCDLRVGNTDRAIERYLQLLDMATKAGAPQYEGGAFEGLAFAYLRRGDITQATALMDEAVRKQRQVSDTGGLIYSLRSAGEIARERGDIERALELHREALELTATTYLRLRLLTEIGKDHAAVGDFARAIANYRAALKIPHEEATQYRRYPAEIGLAESLLAQPAYTPRDLDEAHSIATRVVEAAAASSNITLEQSARTVLARSLVLRGDLTEARAEYERAMALVLRYRAAAASPEQRATTIGKKQDIFQGYVDLVMREVAARGPDKLRPVSRAEEDGLRALELTRAMGFDSLRVARADPLAQARIDELLEQMAEKRVQAQAVLDRASTPGRELETLQLDIARLRAQVDREVARATGNGSPENATSASSQPWPALEHGVTQLSYALGARHAYLWVRDASGIRATILSRHAAWFDGELARLATLNTLATAAQLDASLTKLTAALLPAGAVAPGAHLEVMVDGAMARVPFAALSSPSEPGRRLAETHSIVMTGSMFDEAPASNEARRALRLAAVWSDSRSPGSTFQPLASAGYEVRMISRLFEDATPASIKLISGQEGSAAALKSVWSQGADVFHFATHGLADLRQPITSLLLLPQLDSNGKPTYLTAGQVQDWRGNADLVYLSACETALGPARFADGMPGLQRAFLRAGARGVVATLWPIEDVYASRFAADFYRRYTAGTPAAQALSETQRAWSRAVRGTDPRELLPRRMTAWAHVYYTR